MEPRRRQASTSTTYSQDEKSHGPSKASGSVTPRPDEDDDGLPRRTRHRNPLPPSSGPLFPPLPPKQPKNSPKASPKTSSRSPAGLGRRLASSSALSSMMGDEEPATEAPADAAATAEAEAPADDTTADPSPTKQAPSASSLSPPPADGDDMDVDDNEPRDEESGEGNGNDDWDAYRRARGVRGFSGSKAVKVEPEEADEEVGDAEEPAAAEADTSVVEKDTNGDQAAEDAESETPAEKAARASRKRRGEEQLLLDDHLLPKEMRQRGQIAPRREKAVGAKGRSEPAEPEPTPKDAEPAEEEEAEEAEDGEAVEETGDDALDDDLDDDDDDSKEITRCVCKHEDIDVMMIQCDKCNVWQHGACMGIWGDDEAPDEYFCEECRPDLHGPLRKWIRSRGRNVANFIAPTPQDLQALHNSHDRHPPSQSKRWSDPELMDPPPAKPPSRSHHRKEPAESATDDGRRSTRGRQLPATTSAPRDKSAITSKDGNTRDRRRSTAQRRVSTGELSNSVSPPPGKHDPPRKRSTMNSRDAAYEEAVKAALEASRREMSGSREREEPSVIEERIKRRRGEEDEAALIEEIKKGKKKKEDADETDSATPAAPAKPKHPNQYTYRPKGGVAAAASPRRGAGTPQPTGPPPVHEHGTRRAGAIASNLASAPYTSASVNNLSWYMPDHLSPYADLLPGPNPVPLEVPTPRALQYLPRNHFLNQRYGPFTEDRDDSNKLILPEERPLRETDGDAANHREPPARVRFPMKRISVTDMRKRVRNVLEYVTRIQDEEARRRERAKLINIPETAQPRPRLPRLDGEAEPVRGKGKAAASAPPEDGDVEMADAEPPVEEQRSPSPAPPSSSQLLDELTRDLIAFQEAFQTGDFESLSFAMPVVRPDPPAPETVMEDVLDTEVVAEPLDAEAVTAALTEEVKPEVEALGDDQPADELAAEETEAVLEPDAADAEASEDVAVAPAPAEDLTPEPEAALIAEETPAETPAETPVARETTDDLKPELVAIDEGLSKGALSEPPELNDEGLESENEVVEAPVVAAVAGDVGA